MKSVDRRVWLIVTSFVLLAGAAWAAARSGLVPLSANILKSEPSVLYLSNSHAPELWVASVQGGTPRQMTSTGGKVFDFHVSQDGSRIAYSVQNEQKGIDLWEMDRAGNQARLLLACQADWCVNPAYSPDGGKIAYSRRQTNLEGIEPGVPRVWIFDRVQGSTDPLYTDANTGGFDPAWSPDGRYLAFFDGLSLGVRILELDSREDFLLESQAGMMGEWSPDGKQLIYLDYLSGEELPYVAVYLLDVDTRQARLILGGEEDPLDYSVPAWSPDGRELAVALRSLSGSPSKQLWTMRLDGSQRKEITTDQLFNHAGYHWSPDGQMLAFQRLELGASASRPQVAVWNRASGEILVLSEDAFHPRWLP